MKLIRSLPALFFGCSLIFFGCQKEDDSIPPPSISFNLSPASVFQINSSNEDLTEGILKKTGGNFSWNFIVETPVGLNFFLFEGWGPVPHVFVVSDTLETYNLDLTTWVYSQDTIEVTLTAIDNLDQVSTHKVILINPED